MVPLTERGLNRMDARNEKLSGAQSKICMALHNGTGPSTHKTRPLPLDLLSAMPHISRRHRARFLAQLVFAGTVSVGAACHAADAGTAGSVIQVPVALDQLINDMKVKSQNLTITRGVSARAPTVDTLDAETLRRQLLPGECLYVLSDHSSAGYSISVASASGWSHHREPTQLQNVFTALTAWKQQQVSLTALTARAPIPRGAQRTPDATTKNVKTEVPSDGQISTWLFPKVLKPSLSACLHLTLQVPGSMATLPWAALPFGEQALLIDRVSVSLLPDIYAIEPSAASHQWRASEAEYALEKALIVGNPRYDDMEWLFPDLPGAQRESMSVAKEAGQASRLLIGVNATKPSLLTELRGQTWDMVYLATHAVADSSQPLDRSFVALTPTGVQANDADTGRLTAREVQSLKLKADLAVLSACQTGLGGAHDAGVIGIGRAFFLAGIPHVITSLWNVDDDATADLMSRFVQQVKLNSNPRFFPADSLRQAMLQARQNDKPISHWASFVHFGLANVFIH